MEPEALELVANVRGDLQGLRALTRRNSLSRERSKELAWRLRKLCVDETLQQAATALGERLRLPGSAEVPPAEELAASRALFTHAPEIELRGHWQKCIFFANLGKQGEPPPEDRELSWGEGGGSLSLAQFLAQRVLSWGPYAVTRGQTISYVANKRGAIHWDTSRKSNSTRDAAFEVLDAMRDNVYGSFSAGAISYTIRVRGPEDDPAKWHRDFVLKGDHLDVAMLDLLHTARLVVTAPGVQRLQKAMDRALR